MYQKTQRYKKIKVKFYRYFFPNSFEVMDENGVVLNCPYGNAVPKPETEDSPAPFDEAVISFTVRSIHANTTEIERVYYHLKKYGSAEAPSIYCGEEARHAG